MLVEAIRLLQDASFVASFAFLIVYPGWRGRKTWFRSPEGRQLVAAYVVFTLVLALGALRNLIGLNWTQWSGRLWLGVASYTALTGVFVWQTVNAVLARSRGRVSAPAAEGQADAESQMQGEERQPQ